MAKKSTSPTSNKKACLCEDGTYSKNCCKGETINQGIGKIEGTVTDNMVSNIEDLETGRTIVTQNG